MGNINSYVNLYWLGFHLEQTDLVRTIQLLDKALERSHCGKETTKKQENQGQTPGCYQEKQQGRPKKTKCYHKFNHPATFT